MLTGSYHAVTLLSVVLVVVVIVFLDQTISNQVRDLQYLPYVTVSMPTVYKIFVLNA